MDDLTFAPAQNDGFFPLPNAAAGDFLLRATAGELKLLLYLYRHAARELPTGEVLAATGLSPSELPAVVQSLAQKGLISVQDGVVRAVPGEQESLRRPRYTTEEVETALERDPNLKTMLRLVQERLGKLLPFEDAATVFSFYDYIGLPPDVIIMLVEYCLQNGKRSVRYMEKVAMDWAARGILTIPAAEQHIKEREQRDTLEGRVRALFGMGKRALSKKERGMVEQWAADGLHEDMLRLAYERAADATGDPTLAYAGKILADWSAKGYRTAEEAMTEQRPAAARKGRGKAAADQKSSLDLDDYEKRALEKFHKGEF